MRHFRYVLFIICIFSTSLFAETIFKPSGVAIEGFDTVSYHTLQQAVRGDAKFAYQWKGADWHFASQANRDLFVNNPEKYAPEYGGYCAYAAAKGALAPVDPTVWTVHNDKLYLNFSRSVGANWNQHRKSYIKRADRNWPKLSQQ